MPRTETVISVFVASPSDVSEERAILEEVIREFNLTWSRTFALRLELLAWETHASPDFGNDAQAVINRQIGDDYDVFVGILWARFGTPTSRAGSGTQDEFERAYKRYLDDPNSVRLMIYFKDEAIRPSEIESEQLAKIEEFKAGIRERKGLSWSFSDSDKFKDLIKLHLNRVVQEWQAPAQSRVPQTAPSGSEVPAEVESEMPCGEGEEEELGFLDHIETIGETSGRFIEVAQRMTDSLHTLSEHTHQRTKEFEETSTLSPEQQLKTNKRIAKRAAGDMGEFVDRAEVDLPIMSESLSAGIDALGKVASLSGDFGEEEAKILRQCLDSVIPIGEAVVTSLESIRNLRSTIAGLPRLSSVFNKSKKRIVAMLGKIVAEYEAAEALADEVKETIRQLLNDTRTEEGPSKADDIYRDRDVHR